MTEKAEMNRIRILIAATALATFTIIPAVAPGACACPHRHYRGRIYYFTQSQYYPTTWCDSMGVLWRGNTGVAQGVVVPQPSRSVHVHEHTTDFEAIPPRTY